jgi:signal transduction histidine kinase
MPRNKGNPAEPVDVIATIKMVISQLQHLAEQRGVDVELARSFEEVRISGTTQALAEALQNLIWNAMEVSPPGGLVRVSVHKRGESVVIDISDDGPGIGREHLSKIFQHGYTTKPGAKGAGLSVVERRLGELFGSITWQSPLNHGHGSRFTLTLRAISAPTDAAPTDAASSDSTT